MAISFSEWLSDPSDLTANPTGNVTQRAGLAWRRIEDKPTSVVFRTASGDLAAQTVRVESDNVATPAISTAGNAPRRRVVVFGVRGHPSITDTDIKEGYRFVLGNDELRCVDLILTIGEVQGLFEAIG
jgi:hypothetical protein